MVKREIKEIAQLLRIFLAKRSIKAEKIIVFGSQAKGNLRQDSDVDIAIVSEDFEGKDIFEKAEMLKGLKWFLVERFLLPFDIIPLSLSEWGRPSLIAQFVKEGVEVNVKKDLLTAQERLREAKFISPKEIGRYFVKRGIRD